MHKHTNILFILHSVTTQPLHLEVQCHHTYGNSTPQGKNPLDLLFQMHITFKETELMKVGSEGMKSYREAHDVMNSDDFVEVAAGDKRARASSASSTGGARKTSRYQ